MGQRGFINLYEGNRGFYWRHFYFIAHQNFNWWSQQRLLCAFCNFFFIWTGFANKFLPKFIHGQTAPHFGLQEYL